MNKTIKDGPQITWYCDWDYFWKHYDKIIDAGYMFNGLVDSDDFREKEYGSYEIMVRRLSKNKLIEDKERQEREKYSFNCLNKKYENTI